MVASCTHSVWEGVEEETSSRSAPRQERNASKARSLPWLSHSSRKRRSACSTTVAAQRKSKSRSAGHDSSACAETVSCDGASAIQSSQETNCTSPPRLRACFFAAASFRKFWSDLSSRERKRPRFGSACLSQLPSSIIRKKSWVRSCASSGEWPRRQTKEKIGRQ